MAGIPNLEFATRAMCPVRLVTLPLTLPARTAIMVLCSSQVLAFL